MPYASRADLEDRYGADEVAQRESMLPDGAVDRILLAVDAQVDAYLAARYAVPLLPVPEIIRSQALAIARYLLLGEAASDRVRQDFDDARAFLRDVQAGRSVLPSVALTPGAAPADSVVLMGRAKVFGGGLR